MSHSYQRRVTEIAALESLAADMRVRMLIMAKALAGDKSQAAHAHIIAREVCGYPARDPAQLKLIR